MKIVAEIAAAWAILWIFYLAVMSLKSARDRGTLTTVGKVLGYPVLIAGMMLNVAVNLTLYSLLLLELPQRDEWLVSARTKRHFRHGTGYRRAVAAWIAIHLLNPFELDGEHV